MRDEHQQSIGRVIARLREEQGWSQRQLAKWVGLDQSAVSRIEAGRRRVSAKELQRFADTFRVSADALLLGLPATKRRSRLRSRRRATPYPAASPSTERLLRRLRAELSGPLRRIVDRGRPQPHPATSACGNTRDIAGRGGRLRLAPCPLQTATHRASSLRSDAERPPLRGSGSRSATSSASCRPAPLRPRRAPRSPTSTASLRRSLRSCATGSSCAGWPEATSRRSPGAPATPPRARRSASPIPCSPPSAARWAATCSTTASPGSGAASCTSNPTTAPCPISCRCSRTASALQVIVARVAGRDDATASRTCPVRRAERPVCAALTAGGVPFVFVNAARPVVLQRFALAHAFAHLVLGHGDVVDGRIHWSRNNPREAAANDFAEEFLAPVRAVHRWYERRGEPRPELETMLELGNAFGISAWAALYRSRAARRIHAKQFAKLNQRLRRARVGAAAAAGVPRRPARHAHAPHAGRVPAARESTAGRRCCACRPPCAPGRSAAVRGGRLSVERAAACLQIDARELAAQLARLGLE